jgi:hypothetical protein
MTRTRFCIALAVALLLIAPVTEAQGPDELYRFFRKFVGLSELKRVGLPVAYRPFAIQVGILLS